MLKMVHSIFSKGPFDNKRALGTADNLSNAKPAVQQRHPGDKFPVSQRGSTKGRQSVPVPTLMMDI